MENSMKFQSITMNNFMRYKGRNVIEFSCDEKKNVTVVLGDNTVGKTTIAQAFRWGLYGAVLAERGKQQEDYQLLNNDILAMMDANSKADVTVELIAVDDEKRYQIKREIIYTRAYPQLIAKEFYKKVSLQISEKDNPDAVISVEQEKIEEVIRELFPKNLSHYFLFDGERWNDVTVNGVRENIRESVHTLTGLSAYQAAIWHLKDMGSHSVIKKFKGKISGSGNMYDNLERDRNRMEHGIEQCKEKIKNSEMNRENYEQKIEEIERYLLENKNTEVLQAKYNQLLVVKRSQSDRIKDAYKNMVNLFSDKAFMLFAQPMIESSIKMVKSVAGVRRDIPHMRQASIDYIIKTGRCICGTPILPESKELECLMEQRNYLPPADIGSLLGEFERTGQRWKRQSSSVYDDIRESAQIVDQSVRAYEETCNQIAAMEQQMEKRTDFSEKRKMLRYYQSESNKLGVEKGTLQGQIENYERQIGNIEAEMKSQEARTEENKKWRERMELAEALYTRLKNDFEIKKNKTFMELNGQIQKNFERMFNAKDKRIQLTENYEIQMLYQTNVGFREEKNLSEGEKIARNFAFIVTIMEYSRNKKAEQLGVEGADTLPIVLDGPFSKLGDKNISLIAKVLPEVSEQVIIFMLDKDWKYTGLDEYVGASYHIEKAADEAYASIRRVELDQQ